MNEHYQVIIIQDSGELPHGLRETLQSKGFFTRVCLSIEEGTNLLRSDTENIVFVHCSDAIDLDPAVDSLRQATQLHGSPLIFIGHAADQYESYLNRYFILATTISLPCTSADVVAAVEYVSKFVQKLRRTPKKIDDAALEAEAAHALYKQFPSIPDLVFDQIIKLGIIERDLGGANYATTFRPDKLPKKSFVPESQEFQRGIDGIADLVSEVKVGRMYRTALLSDLFFLAIGISGDNLEAARAAAFLHASGFIVNLRDLYLNEYLTDEKEEMRKELGTFYKQTAINLSEAYQSPVLGAFVGSAGRLLCGDEYPSEAIEHLGASSILTADMIDRFVYRRETFQPVVAYSVLSRLKKAPVRYIHPLVLGCAIKILAEAVSSKASNILIDRKMRTAQHMVQASDAVSDAILSEKEDQIPLSLLSPGMKLARPVGTYDGRALLDEELVLDHDLIWRLWQLSSIRPIKSPVIFRVN